MLFITLILALAFELTFVYSERLKNFSWLSVYRNFIIKLFRKTKHWDGPIGVLAILFIPILIISLLQTSDIFRNSLFGLVGITGGVLMLAYCLRYRSMDRAIDSLTAADDKSPLDSQEALAVREILGEQQQPIQDRFSLLTEAVLVQANERLFAVLFWFLVFGPAGALAYRMTWYMTESPLDPGEIEPDGDDLDAASYRLFGILSWVPARICAAGYALAGQFEDALSEWKEPDTGSQYDFCASNIIVLGKAGMGALRLNRYRQIPKINRESGEKLQEDTLDTVVNAEAVKAARALVLRTLLLGCTILALITLTGWIVS